MDLGEFDVSQFGISLMDPRDTVIEVKGSPVKLFGLTILGMGMTVLSALVAFQFIPVEDGSFNQFMGWIGMLFFGLATAIGISRLFTFNKTVMTLSTAGLHDTRISARPVPWEAIEDFGVWEMQRQKIIVISVLPETEASIGMTRMARWSRAANAKLGANGLCFSAAGLSVGHEALLSAIGERVGVVGS